MIRSELVQKLSKENPHLFQRDAERILDVILETITDALARGERVELRGFGSFSVVRRDARLGRNPKTGQTVQVEEKHVHRFKASKKLLERLNDKSADDPGGRTQPQSRQEL